MTTGLPTTDGAPTPSPSFHIQTLGCRVNQYEEEVLRQEFLRRGFHEVTSQDAADVCVINTCTVTHVADRKSRQLIQRALRANPQARVIATGCAVENRHALGEHLPDRVIQVSNRDKERLLDVVRGQLPPHHEADTLLRPVQARARALLKVQDGCDAFCSFCIVPFVRGRSRSRPPQEVLAEARTLVEAGYRELVVTGVHVGAYGRGRQDPPQEWGLGRLLRLLAEASGAERIRLSSVEPADFPRDVLDLMGGGARGDERSEPTARVCRHLHLALQHASDRVLDRMRRGYTLADCDAIVGAFLGRFPDGALAADVLVGFPGEDEADFAILHDYLASRPFAHLHVFPYSDRPGTAASRLPDHVPDAVREQRRQALLALGRRQERAFRERFRGATVEVLVEEHRAGHAVGLTDNYLSVQLGGPPAPLPPLGAIVPVAVVAVNEDGLQGRWLR